MAKGKKLKKKRATLELAIAKLEEALLLAKQREQRDARERELAGAGSHGR